MKSQTNTLDATHRFITQQKKVPYDRTESIENLCIFHAKHS